MRVALYLRVSTDKQTVESQRDKLLEFCKAKEYEVAGEYQDIMSGKESERPEFKRMLDDAGRGLFNAIVVWDFSRFTREGAAEMWAYFKRLQEYNVSIFSYSEPILNTENPIARDIIFTLYASMAKAEREWIVARTNKSLDTIRKHIKENGSHVSKAGNRITKLGRPRVMDKIGVTSNQILELWNKNMSVRRMSRELHIKRSTLSNYIQEMSKNGTLDLWEPPQRELPPELPPAN